MAVAGASAQHVAVDPDLFIRFGVLGLIAGVGFLVFLVQGIARACGAPEIGSAPD
jgi:hypothetical protein